MRVIPELRRMVDFQRINFMEDFSVDPMDIIFCRNVVIYFDKPTQEKLFKKFCRILSPGGHLFIRALRIPGRHGSAASADGSHRIRTGIAAAFAQKRLPALDERPGPEGCGFCGTGSRRLAREPVSFSGAGAPAGW